MQSPDENLLTRISAVPLLLLMVLNGCGPGEVNQEEAAGLADEFEAGANNAVDETEAQVLRERANSMREVSQGNEEAKDRVKVIGE